MGVEVEAFLKIVASFFECILPSTKLRATYLRTSSNRITGNDIFNTAHHSNTVNGHNEKTTFENKKEN